MRTAPALLETERRFLDALVDAEATGPLAAIAGNGLEPAARLRIYQRSCNEIQTSALRTTYPAVLALVDEAFFDQTARGYRAAYPSHGGNLQAFGECFAEHLASLPAVRELPYLPDVARLEWLRQETALAADAEVLPRDSLVRISAGDGGSLPIRLHPSVRLLASRHPVLTIWRYAMQPTPEGLTLSGVGEQVVLWREDGQVAMGTPDAASFACIAALATGSTLDGAYSAGRGEDADFDFPACIASLVARGLLTAITSPNEQDGLPPCKSSKA